MTYKILSTRQIENTLFTTVEYNFDFGIKEIEIPHDSPDTSSDEAFQANVEQNIKNVADSLIAKEIKTEEIVSVLPTLEIGVDKPLE
jgi:hypothetical protein